MEKVPLPPVDGYATCPLEKAWRCIFDFPCKGSIQEACLDSRRGEEYPLSTPVAVDPCVYGATVQRAAIRGQAAASAVGRAIRIGAPVAADDNGRSVGDAADVDGEVEVRTSVRLGPGFISLKATVFADTP